MAELGHEVIGVDVDRSKVARLSAGEIPFYEPGLPELLSKHVTSGRLRLTTAIAEAAEFAELRSSASARRRRWGSSRPPRGTLVRAEVGRGLGDRPAVEQCALVRCPVVVVHGTDDKDCHGDRAMEDIVRQAMNESGAQESIHAHHPYCRIVEGIRQMGEIRAVDD